jgi:hypothetical protein
LKPLQLGRDLALRVAGVLERLVFESDHGLTLGEEVLRGRRGLCFAVGRELALGAFDPGVLRPRFRSELARLDPDRLARNGRLGRTAHELLALRPVLELLGCGGAGHVALVGLGRDRPIAHAVGRHETLLIGDRALRQRAA